MTADQLLAALRKTVEEQLPLPGYGDTPLRHRRLMEVGRETLSLARLAEAHWDAVAILSEAGRKSKTAAIYGVWAAEKAGASLQLEKHNGRLTVSGTKVFCSGAGLIDRALVTSGAPQHFLFDIDLAGNSAALNIDCSTWKTVAFRETQTATVTFNRALISANDFVGGPGWYLSRPGFWHGACGPAACWAGGAAGLLDYALQQSRDDPHTSAHLGAMYACIWGMESVLQTAGREIDDQPADASAARIRARLVRHLIEQASTEVLRRLTRAYGPFPLAMEDSVWRRYQELDLYLRQWHAERDLEALGSDVRSQRPVPSPNSAQ